jgi:hypothetical protein
MATDKDIGFKIEVEGVEQSISSIKDLKKAIKDATDEQIKASEKFGVGSKEYQKASQRVSELKDKVDDLKDSTKSLQGSGIERASAGFSQLGEGLKNLDFDKVKVGFAAMKTAIAAVGIGLIIQLVQYLIENFDRLSQGSNGVAKALRFVGDIIGEILKVGEQMLNFLTDAIGLTSELERQQEAMGKAAIDSFTKSKEALAEQTAEMDRNIKVAKAMGKNTVEMEIEKQKAIIETNKQYLLQLQQMAKTRAITEEERKLIKESSKAIKDAKAEITIIEANDAKEKEAKQKEADEKAKANREKILAEKKKQADEEKKFNDEFNKDITKRFQDEQKRLADEALLAQQQEDAKIEAQIQAENLIYQEKKRIRDEYAEKERAGYAELEKEKYNLTLQGLQAGQQLSDMYFLFKSKNLKKGSKEEEEMARKAFEVNKALQLSTAVVSGFQAVQGAYATAQLSPITTVFPAYPFIQAALAGVTSAANIAKIAASKFSSSGGGDMGGGGAPASAPIPPPPTVSNPNANIEGSKFDEQGNKISNGSAMPAIQVNATVGVDEISAKTNRVNVLEKQSTF